MTIVSRILASVAVGTLVFGLIVVIFLMIEEPLQIPFAYAVAPGLFLQQLLERLGQEHTNRFAVWATLVFWWVLVFCVMSVIRRFRIARQIDA